MALSTNEDYINLLIGRLGRRDNTDATMRALIVDEINSSIVELEHGRFLPWFLETSTTLVTVADIRTTALPTGFLRETENQAIQIADTTGTLSHMIKLRLEDLDALYRNDAAAQPGFYAIGEPNIYWGKTPNAAYNISFPYMAATTAIADNTNAATNKWLTLAHNFILSHAGTQVASLHLQNEKLAGIFGAITGRARMELVGHNEARQHTNMDYSDADNLVGVK